MLSNINSDLILIVFIAIPVYLMITFLPFTIRMPLGN